MAASLAEVSVTDSPDLRIGYEGCKGSYSSLAAAQCFPKSTTAAEGHATLASLISAINAGSLDRAVVPVENTHSGTFASVIDTVSGSGLAVVGDFVASERHVLCGTGSDISAIKSVASHPKVLELASGWLRDKFGAGSESVTMVVCQDTALACEQAAAAGDVSRACLASEEAAKANGLSVLGEIPFESGEPMTRYFILAKSAPDGGSRGVGAACKTSMTCVLKNQPAALFKLLSCFALRDLNVSKIEMIPLARSGNHNTSTRAFEYTTFLDIESGEANDPRLVNALSGAEEFCSHLKVLGTYPRFGQIASASYPFGG